MTIFTGLLVLVALAYGIDQLLKRHHAREAVELQQARVDAEFFRAMGAVEAEL